jgi:hypothetical protein
MGSMHSATENEWTGTLAGAAGPAVRGRRLIDPIRARRK